MPVTSIIRVSTAADGTQGNGSSFSPVFSPDGTKVAFFGYASNFVSDDTNGNLDIFVKTLGTGAIERISTDAASVQANGDSYYPVFSPDGTKVFFESAASNLAPGDTSYWSDIYAKTLATGAIERVSSDAMGAPGDGSSSGPVSFSLDGTKVAFYSEASNFVADDTNPWFEVFVKTLATGAFERASTDAMGVPGNSSSYGPVLSPDGAKVAFTSYASNLVAGDTNGTTDVFIKTLATSAIARVSTDAAGGEGNGGSDYVTFSPNGTKVAFYSAASNLVAGDKNSVGDIFVKDLATCAISLVSTAAAGTLGNGYSVNPVFSPDGTKVAFLSGASNLVPGDTNGTQDIFVKTLATGAIERISTDAAGVQANGGSFGPVFSPDGTRVVFASGASNFVPSDTNNADDIFVATLGAAPPTKIFHNITNNTNRSQFKAVYAGDDSIDGTGGADRIRGWAGRDTIWGEGGNDEIRGDGVGLPYDPDLPDTDPVNFADSIRAGAGNDSVWGGGGADTLLGEDGSDRLYGQGGGDVIYGGRGNDEIVGAEDDDELRGDAGNDWIVGGPGANSIFGGDGDDKIYAFAGADFASRWGWVDDGELDYVYGGAGNDTLIGSADRLSGGLSGGDGDDLIVSGPTGADASGGDGNDRMIGGDGFDVFSADDGNDRLEGGRNHDNLDGGGGDDYIDGGDGDDYIHGGSGNNTIVAGGGNDQIYLFNAHVVVDGYNDPITNDFIRGGPGEDLYYANIDPYEPDNVLPVIGNDVIADFVKGDDQLGIYSGSNPTVRSFDHLDTNHSGVLDAGDDYVRIAGGTILDFSALYGETPGSQTITFLGVTGLSAQDVLIYA